MKGDLTVTQAVSDTDPVYIDSGSLAGWSEFSI